PRAQLLVGHPFMDALDGDGGGDQRRRPAGHAYWRGGQYAEGREHVPVARRAAREHDPGLFEGHLGAVAELVSAFPALHERRVADARERSRKVVLAELQAHQLLRAGGWRAQQQEKNKARGSHQCFLHALSSRNGHSVMSIRAMASRTRGSHSAPSSCVRSLAYIVSDSAHVDGWQHNSVIPGGNLSRTRIKPSTVIRSGAGVPSASCP